VIPTVAGGRWIQNRRRNRSFAVVWGLLAWANTITAVALLFSGMRAGKFGGGLVVFAMFLIMAMITARWAVGCAGAGLLVTEQTVVIRNPWRRREVPVAELRRFAAGYQAGGYGQNPTPGINLELKSGSTYSVWTLGREGFVWNSARNVVGWVAVAQELNELVHSAP
jgi:Zn-dependent protease with chaperone function